VFRCWFFFPNRSHSSCTYRSVLLCGNQRHGSTYLLLQQQTYYQVLVPMKLIPHCMACHSFSPIQSWKTKGRNVRRECLRKGKNPNHNLLICIPKFNCRSISSSYIATIPTHFSTCYRWLCFKSLNNFATSDIP